MNYGNKIYSKLNCNRKQELWHSLKLRFQVVQPIYCLRSQLRDALLWLHIQILCLNTLQRYAGLFVRCHASKEGTVPFPIYSVGFYMRSRSVLRDGRGLGSARCHLDRKFEYKNPPFWTSTEVVQPTLNGWNVLYNDSTVF